LHAVSDLHKQYLCRAENWRRKDSIQTLPHTEYDTTGGVALQDSVPYKTPALGFMAILSYSAAVHTRTG
jgi:hypothetical protein